MTGIAGAEGRSRITAIIFFGIALTCLGAPQVLLNAGAAAYLLTYHGVQILPLTYLGAAFIMIPAVIALTYAGRRADAATILIGATAFRILVAVVLFIAAALGYGEFVGVAASLWVRVDMVIGLMTVWRLAGKVFDAPGDRSWLGYLAVCDPVSTMIMGLAGPLIAGAAGVAVVFAIAALALAAACPPALLIRAQLREEQDRFRGRRRKSRPTLRPLSPSMRRYLILVIAAMAVWAVAHFQLDILLHGFAGLRFDTLDARFDFFAYTLAAAGLFGVGFTAFGQGRLLRAYGVRLLLIVLPIVLIATAAVGLALSSAFDAPFALFAAVTVMKVVEFALVSGFYTRAWRGLLSPLPDTHRDRLIAMVNRNVHAVGAVFGAGVGFTIISMRGFDADAFTAAFLVLSALGLILSFYVLKGFVAALERALARRQSIEDMELGAADRRSREVVQQMLRDGGGRDAIEAARLQAALDVDGFVHMAPRLIAKGDRNVVRKLLDTVREIARPELFPPMAGRLTIEEDPEVRDALMTAAAATGHPRSARLLAKSLADQPDDPPMGALIGLGRHGGLFGGAVANQFLERYSLNGEAQLSRALDAARQIGPNAPTGPVAIGLKSPDPATRRKAIRAAGKIGDPTLANLVVQQLADPRERRAAALALSAIGEGAVSELASAIGDREAPFPMRAAALRALGDIAGPEAMEQLMLHADSRDPRLRVAAHLALWRAGAVLPRDKHAALLDHCRRELLDAAEAHLAGHDLGALGDERLRDAVRHRSQRSLTCAVRAAGLTRTLPRNLDTSFSAIFGAAQEGARAARGAAMIPEDLSAVFSAVASGAEGDLESIRAFAGHSKREPADWLGHMLTDARWTTDWLRAASFHHLMRTAPEERETLLAAANDPGPILSQVIAEMGEAKETEKGEAEMALNTVEKVLILKTADLFQRVPDEDLAEIAPFMTSVYLDPGEHIITEGELGEELYIVVAGEVSVQKNGEELVRRGERAVFGDLAALDPEPRSASVVATKPTQLLSLSNEHLLALFESNVEIASGVIASLIGRLRRGEV